MNEATHKRNLSRIVAALKEIGVTEVRVEFDGQGDSGSIEYTSYTPSEKADQARRTNLSFRTDDDIVDKSLEAALEALVYERLEDSGIDWYNNDGGYGYYKLNVANGTLEFEINTRYTSSNTELYEEVELDL